MQPVERSEVEGVDYGWVMQTTFVLTILLGAPLVALLSTAVTLDSWGARAMFAVRVGAPIWFVTAVGVFLYARRTDAGDVVNAADVDREDVDREDVDREDVDREDVDREDVDREMDRGEDNGKDTEVGEDGGDVDVVNGLGASENGGDVGSNQR